MPERWQRELEKWGEVQAPERMRVRVDEGPKGDGMPPDPSRGQRVLAGVVAFAVFGVAAAVALGAFGSDTPVPIAVGPGAPKVLVATSTKPADGSQPSLELTYGDTAASIHPQGGTWRGTEGVYTAELQSLPGDVLPGTTIAFKGDWDGLSADVRYGMPGDSPTQPLSLSADEIAGGTGATATLPDVPGRYVILVHAGWNLGTGGATELSTAEYTFLVAIRDPADLTVSVDGQTPEPPYVHAQFQGGDDLRLVPVATGAQPSQEPTERITVPEGTSIWVVGEATEIQALLDATFADTQLRFESVSTPGGPAAVLRSAPAGTWVLDVALRWEGGEGTFMLMLQVTGTSPAPSPSSPSVSPAGISADDLRGTSWQLEFLDGRPVPAIERGPVTLVFSDDRRLGGFDGCNAYGADWILRDGLIEILGGIQSTLIACSGEAGPIEDAFRAILSGSPVARDLDGRLELRSEAGVATFTRIDVSDPNDPARVLDCPPSEQVAFAPAPDAVLLGPAPPTALRANLGFIRDTDEVVQVSGPEDWTQPTVWNVLRDGLVIAVVRLPTFDVVACRSSVPVPGPGWSSL